MAEVCGEGWEGWLWKKELLVRLLLRELWPWPHELGGLGHRMLKRKT